MVIILAQPDPEREASDIDEDLSTTSQPADDRSQNDGSVDTITGHSGLPAPVFSFDGTGDPGATAQIPSESTFTFRAMHNVTPLQSRSPPPEITRQDRGNSSLLPSPFRTPSPDLVVFHSPPSGSSIRTGGPTGGVLLTPSSSPVSAWSTGRQDTLLPREARPSPPELDISLLSITSVARAELVPYNVNEEQMPSHQFFSVEFQNTLKNGLEIAKEVVPAIDGLADVVGQDDALAGLRKDAQELKSFHATDTKTIAVLGDSGEGKSSLINSLLGFPGLAKTGDIGSACTSVVTEYRQKRREHTARITIEVECMSQSGISEMVTELLWSYRTLYLPGVESSATSEEDYVRYTRESAQAWSALEAAFGHHSEFTEVYLRDMSEGSLERITAVLVEWSTELEWPEGVVDGRWAATAASAGECCEMTQLFMQDQYWPFTKIIRIYLNAQVLKTGVVLADLPGLQDTNLARVRATHNYLMRCNNVFIVAKISRAVTDQSLKSSLFSAFSRHVPEEWEDSAAQSLNIAVVCTRSEDINLQTARQQFCGSGNQIDPSVIDRLDRGIDAAKAARNRTLKKELKLRRELRFIEARNQHVTEGLQTAYASKAPNRKLDVFCVSNKLYEKYTRKGNTEVVLASGIPGLRNFCHSISADAQFREAKYFLRSSLFSLVNSLHLWTSSALLDRDEDSRDPEETRRMLGHEVKEAHTRCANAILKYRRDFDKSFKEQIQALLGNRHVQWEEAAASEGHIWKTKWHWTQYSAWCRNNGHHYTAKRGREDWNAKIIWKMRAELEYQWDLVEEEIPELFRALSSSAESTLRDLKDNILGLFADEFRPLLSDGIEARIRDFAFQISLSEQKFAQEFRLIWRYASESNHSSYVLGEMLPAYRSASNHFGKGMADRQYTIVQGRIEDGTLFPDISFVISEQVKTLVGNTEDELRGVARRVLGQIRGDLDISLVPTRDSQQATRSMEDKQKLNELSSVVENLKMKAGDVAGALEAGGS